jgi:hypothetical protein
MRLASDQQKGRAKTLERLSKPMATLNPLLKRSLSAKLIRDVKTSLEIPQGGFHHLPKKDA